MNEKIARIDALVTCAIVITVLVAVFGVWLTSPARHAQLHTSATPFEPVATTANVPDNTTRFHTAFQDANVANQAQPVVADGLLLLSSPEGRGTRVEALDPAENAVVWSYSRSDALLCTAMRAWQTVSLVFRTDRGCGDVITLDAATGEYAKTRSSNTADEVLPVWSNDRVGIITEDRVELWRSDMVRTVEYGAVENPQEAEMQPHADEHCAMQSALTRKELLAVVEVCRGSTWLRLQKVTPEDSRAPELHAEVPLADGARVVAIGQTHAVVYSPTPTPELITYNDQGEETARFAVEPAAFSDELDDAAGAVFPRNVFEEFTEQERAEAGQESPDEESVVKPHVNAQGFGLAQPIVADLPHHISWFDGHRLYLFTPETMEVAEVFDDAIGTAVAVSGNLYYPTTSGINVANWSTGEAIKSIPVDRDGYRGVVNLAQANGMIVESRGQDVAVLVAEQ